MVALLHIGKSFSNYDDLRKEIDNFEKTEDIELWVRDSRTVNAASKRARRKILNPALVYAELTYACVFGGRKPSDRNKERIHSQTSAKGCPYKVRFSTSNDGQSLVVKEMHTDHNHDPALKLDRSKRRVNRQGEPKRRLKRSASFDEFSPIPTEYVTDAFGTVSKVPRLDGSIVPLHPGSIVANSFSTSRNIINSTQFNIVKNFDVLRQVPTDYSRSNVNIQFTNNAIKQEYNIKQQLSEFEYQRKDGLNDAESDRKLPCRTPSCDADSRSNTPVSAPVNDDCLSFHHPMSPSASLSPFSWEQHPPTLSDELVEMNEYLENNISLHPSFENEGEALGFKAQVPQQFVVKPPQQSVPTSSVQSFTPITIPNKQSRIILPNKHNDSNNNAYQMHRVTKTESSTPMQLTRSGFPLTPPEEPSPPSHTSMGIKREPFEFPVIKSEPEESLGRDLPFVDECKPEMNSFHPVTTCYSTAPIIKKENGLQTSILKIPSIATTVLPGNTVKPQKLFNYCPSTQKLTSAGSTNRPVIATTSVQNGMNGVKKLAGSFEVIKKQIINMPSIPRPAMQAQITSTPSSSSSVTRPYVLQPQTVAARPAQASLASAAPKRAVGPLKVVKTEKISPPLLANSRRVIPQYGGRSSDVLISGTSLIKDDPDLNLIDDKIFGDIMNANFDTDAFNDFNNLDSIIDDSLFYDNSIPPLELESISVV